MRKIILILCLFLTTFYTNAQQQYFELKDFVTDSAHIFNKNQVESLKQRLVNFEQQTTNQVVIVTIEELGFDTIESYALSIFNQNGIGKKDADNGLLILFSRLDREVRIEVGYGLEAYITDAVASRIIRNTMIPNFKKKRYYEGINEGAEQIIEFLSNPEALAEFKQEIEESERKDDMIAYGFLGLFVLIFVVVGGFAFFKSYMNLWVNLAFYQGCLCF